jgi:hypothetical protein
VRSCGRCPSRLLPEAPQLHVAAGGLVEDRIGNGLAGVRRDRSELPCGVPAGGDEAIERPGGDWPAGHQGAGEAKLIESGNQHDSSRCATARRGHPDAERGR